MSLRLPRPIHHCGRRVIACALLLALAIVAPYNHLLRFDQVLLTDDVSISDAFDAELPVRAWIGAHGAAWTGQIYGGFPFAVGNETPLGYGAFHTLPPAAALDAFLLVGLLVAGFGARAFANALGASPTGALLAGLVYAQSGYIVSRMRHSEIFEISVLLPWGLLAMERLVRPRAETVGGRLPGALALSAVFAWQVLAGFPQVAYYSGLAYVGWFLLRARGPIAARLGQPLGVAALASAVALLIGAPGIWPLADLARHSNRGATWLLNDRIAEVYAPARIVGFLFPYADGDGSTLTAGLTGLYWEDYTYMGVLTFLLAVGSLRLLAPDHAGSRSGVAALWTIGLVAFLFALGPNTPFYAAVWHVVPGVAMFRLPTRALVVTELALAVLAGLALSALEARLAMARKQRPGLPRVGLLSGLVVVVTMADLSARQLRQNAWGEADAWLAPPDTARFLLQPGNEGRYFALGHYAWHTDAIGKAGGWAGDLGEVLQNRGMLGPNLSLYWGLQAIQGYAGAAPAWSAAMWGSPQERGLIDQTMQLDGHEQAVAAPSLGRLLGLGHVRWVVTHVPIVPPEGWPMTLKPVWQGTYARVYEVPDVMPRAWVVPSLTRVADDDAVIKGLSTRFDAWRTAFVIADDVPAPLAGNGRATLDGEPTIPADGEPTIPPDGASTIPAHGLATITAEGDETLDIDAAGPGTLIVADTWYPGWVATVDGVETPIWRANLWQRAIPLPPGAHHVHLAFALPKLRESRWLQAGGALVWAAAGIGVLWARRYRRIRASAAADAAVSQPSGTPL